MCEGSKMKWGMEVVNHMQYESGSMSPGVGMA